MPLTAKLHQIYPHESPKPHYCDIRPNMIADAMLAQHIKTLDHFLISDLRGFMGRPGTSLPGIELE